jgi:hypothetical protein
LAAVRNLLPIHGEEFQPSDGELPVRGLNLTPVRRRFETTYVELDRDDDTPEKRADRTRKAYKRALDDLMAEGMVAVATVNSKVMVWVK